MAFFQVSPFSAGHAGITKAGAPCGATGALAPVLAVLAGMVRRARGVASPRVAAAPLPSENERPRFSNEIHFDMLVFVMRKFLCLSLFAALSLFVIPCYGEGHVVEAKNWQKLHTYDVRTLAPEIKNHMHELVAIKGTFRGKDIHHLKPNWYEGSLWQPDPKARKHFADVRVLIAKADLSTFKSITTDSSAGQEMTFYGTVELDFDSHFLFVRLLGRNVSVDAKGNATITW
jgi:hypothetical protein